LRTHDIQTEINQRVSVKIAGHHPSNRGVLMNFLSSLVVILGLSLTSTVFANDLNMDLKTSTVAVETPSEVVDQILQDHEAAIQPEGILENDVSIEQIVNLGKQVWAFIEDGKPVVNINYNYSNAVPQGITDVSALANFSDLQMKSYRVSAKNPYGATVYDVTYTLVHQYGGTYDDKGQYLSTVSVIPSNITVLWGYTLNYNVTKVTALNVGNSENPVGSVLMEMTMKVSTIIKSSSTSRLYQFRGDKKTVIKTL
jgi:hypothetical protein